MKPNPELADLIDQAMNSDDEIDLQYLLEALTRDLRAGTVSEVQDLIDNPVS